MTEFASSPRSTVGIEWELALVDEHTGELVPQAPAILAVMRESFPEDRFPHATAELLTNTIELVSAPHATVADAVADLRMLALASQAAAQTHGAHLIGAGGHPFSTAQQQSFTPSARYESFAERYQWWGRNMLIWGTHLHIGVDRVERVIPIMHALLSYLPHFLALSASSPYWAGEHTGYQSHRTLLFQQLPSAGLPPDTQSWEEFTRIWAEFETAGILTSPSEARWDIRPAPQWGTIEIRVCDSVTSLAEIGMLAALTQCLSELFHEQLDTGHPLPRLPQWCVQENKWRAARYGCDATIITSPAGAQRTLRDDLTQLITQLEPIAARLGCAHELAHIAVVLRDGNGAHRQLMSAAHTTAPPHALVVHDLAAAFARGVTA